MRLVVFTFSSAILTGIFIVALGAALYYWNRYREKLLIEPVPQSEHVEVPPTMLQGGESFALRVKGESMRDDGILPGDLVIVHKQATARNGQTIVALVNSEATIKKFYRKGNRIELHPANALMKPIIVTDRDDFRIEGMVIGVIRHLT